MRKLDLKSIVIIILGIALIISFFFGQKSNVDYKKKEIEALHKANDSLSNVNIRLTNMNTILKSRVNRYKIVIEENKTKITESELKIYKLTYEKNKIYNSVHRMSANDVSRSFTNYLNKRIESKRSNY
jgi:hypothetical protein